MIGAEELGERVRAPVRNGRLAARHGLRHEALGPLPPGFGQDGESGEVLVMLGQAGDASSFSFPSIRGLGERVRRGV